MALGAEGVRRDVREGVATAAVVRRVLRGPHKRKRKRRIREEGEMKMPILKIVHDDE